MMPINYVAATLPPAFTHKVSAVWRWNRPRYARSRGSNHH